MLCIDLIEDDCEAGREWAMGNDEGRAEAMALLQEMVEGSPFLLGWRVAELAGRRLTAEEVGAFALIADCAMAGWRRTIEDVDLADLGAAQGADLGAAQAADL